MRISMRSLSIGFISLVALTGVVKLSHLSTEFFLPTHWAYNDAYNPLAEPVYGDECGYSYAEGEQCDSVLLNNTDYEQYIPYHTYIGSDEYVYWDEETPLGPLVTFLVIYGVGTYFAVKKLYDEDGVSE